MREEDKKNIQRFIEQVRFVDELVQVVLKGHLLIEEALGRILSKFVFHPEHVDDASLRFGQAVAITRSLSLDENNNRMWDLILAVNALRNDLAHALDSPKRSPKLQRLKEMYFEICKDDRDINKGRELDDHIVVIFAVALCLGFLSSFEREVERFRWWVNRLNWIVNPHRGK